MTTKTVPFSLFERDIVKQAVVDSFKKLGPRQQMKNPVMFVVWVGSVLTTALFFQALFGHGEAPSGFILAITLWLWFTVLFANFAEALAEGRSRAQAASMRSAKRDIQAKKLTKSTQHYGGKFVMEPSSGLRKDDVVLVEAGDFIPGDG
ncbi:MAG: potassium-transporting ATPase subunit B, partial [Gallionella sp.]|nr:potassium-transporting ATPase subunit B [Gallionella sp.]